MVDLRSYIQGLMTGSALTAAVIVLLLKVFGP